MTNDELRLSLDRLTDGQMRAVVREHYPSVAEWAGQADRSAVLLTLMDYVDRHGDTERNRLSQILAVYRPAGGDQNGRSVTSDNISHTVTALQTQMAYVRADVQKNQAQIEEIARQFLLVLRQLESLQTNVQWLTGAIVLGVIVVGILLLRVLGV